jgi:hypothetical protein
MTMIWWRQMSRAGGEDRKSYFLLEKLTSSLIVVKSKPFKEATLDILVATMRGCTSTCPFGFLVLFGFSFVFNLSSFFFF